MNGGAIIGTLIGLVAMLAIGTLIGAVFLRGGIALYNKFAGGEKSESGVSEPPFGRAMWIMFITSLVQAAVSFVIGLIIGGAGAARGASERQAAMTAQLIAFPVGLVVMSGMLSSLLPTTFGRALMVSLCYLLIVILVFGTLGTLAYFLLR